MATQLQLALRLGEAYGRIDTATRKLAKALGAKYSSGGEVRHRDPQIEQILRVERVAESLEALVKAQAKTDKAQETPAPDAAVGKVTVETVEVVETGKAGVPKGKSR